jgi:catechol 2,3-dioxygenase-like lactoylglutathione lyase family enzyme
MTDMRLELVTIPVTDVDRAIAFYTERAGFTLDHDHDTGDGTRFVQITPPGSACSIAFGTGQAAATGGPAQLQVVVEDAQAAREDLLGRGLDPGELQDFPWGRFVFFTDPDGNIWAVQEIPPRP